MNEEELVYEKNKCCGCGLCAQKCPKNAITMKEDEYGFIYPYIDKSKCINCNICKNVCSFNKPKFESEYEVKAYAAVSKDKEILKSTASGGVFTSIAMSFIKDGGVVYGCSMENIDDKFIVRHTRVANEDELEELKGSKYVQSDITGIFNKVSDDLKNGYKVLFSGTPCQVASVKKYCKEFDKNLYTIDIICHGVPSNKMFNDYIDYVNNKKNIRIKEFKFRSKEKGWGLYYYYYFKDLKRNNYKSKVTPAFKSSFYQLFLDSSIYRDSCYNCKYACKYRVGDITIGDYWGIEKEHPDLISSKCINKNSGVSCLIINNYKGNKMIDLYREVINCYDSLFEKIAIHNEQLNKKSNMSNIRNKIMEHYKNLNYTYIDNYYNNMYFFKNIIKSIYYYIIKRRW